MPTGEKIGNYVLVRRLGGGGMGEVWEARDTLLDRLVALKCIHDLNADTPSLAKRFMTEARILARLRHPAIVPIHNCLDFGGRLYLVMELIHGRSLGEIVRHSGPRSVPQCVDWFRQAAAALGYAHEQGIHHRDIKPTNIMIDEMGNLRLIDFGLAVSRDASVRLTQTGAVVGTLPYMAPEQFLHGTTDAQSDIYSLALTFYYALTGVNSVRQSNGAHDYEPLPNFPRALDRIFRKCLDPRPEKRYRDAVDLALDLSLVYDVSAYRRVWTPSGVQRLILGGMIIMGAAGLAAGIGLFANFVYRNDDNAIQSGDSSRAAPGESTPQSAASPETVQKASGDSLQVSRQAEFAGQDVTAEQGARSPSAVENRSSGTMELQESAPASLSGSEPGITAEMIAIPAGTCVLGMDKDDVPQVLRQIDGWEALAEGGRRKVEVDEFKIDKYEVTNAQYAVFLKETGRQAPAHWNGTEPPVGMENHPAVNVTYTDAVSYAQWAGKRLPTADEWEKAARGKESFLYPWGNEFVDGISNTDQIVAEGTSPVDFFPEDRSSYGIVGAGGNAAEWTSSTKSDDVGNTGRVVCGGSWAETGPLVSLAPYRRAALEEFSRIDISFRCAR